MTLTCLAGVALAGAVPAASSPLRGVAGGGAAELDGRWLEEGWRTGEAVREGPLHLRWIRDGRGADVLGVGVEEPAKAVLRSRATASRPQEVRLDDHLEIALAEGRGDAPRYYRLWVNAKGVAWGLIQEPGADGRRGGAGTPWQPAVRTAVGAAPLAWTVELSLPKKGYSSVWAARRGPSAPLGQPSWHELFAPPERAAPGPAKAALSVEALQQQVLQGLADPRTFERFSDAVKVAEDIVDALCDPRYDMDGLVRLYEERTEGYARRHGIPAETQADRRFFIKQMRDDRKMPEEMKQVALGVVRFGIKSFKGVMGAQAEVLREVARQPDLSAFRRSSGAGAGEGPLKLLKPRDVLWGDFNVMNMAGRMGQDGYNVMQGYSVNDEGHLISPPEEERVPWGGQALHNLPEQWDQLTEEQYQALRKALLIMHTPAFEAYRKETARRWRDASRGGSPVPTRLGLTLQVLDAPLKALVGEDAGLLVRGAAPGGPAARAGLATGDVLLAADGRMLAKFRDLHEALEKIPDGGSLTLRYKRRAETRTLRVVLGPP